MNRRRCWRSCAAPSSCRSACASSATCGAWPPSPSRRALGRHGFVVPKGDAVHAAAMRQPQAHRSRHRNVGTSVHVQTRACVLLSGLCLRRILSDDVRFCALAGAAGAVPGVPGGVARRAGGRAGRRRLAVRLPEAPDRRAPPAPVRRRHAVPRHLLRPLLRAGPPPVKTQRDSCNVLTGSNPRHVALVVEAQADPFICSWAQSASALAAGGCTPKAIANPHVLMRKAM